MPAAAQYFQITTDDWDSEDYIYSGNTFTIKYFDPNEMPEGNFVNGVNPVQLLFRKNPDKTDNFDFRVTKILVNEASTFDSPLGDNTTGQGTQKKSSYLAGRYATYNNATDGGLNFSDFRIASINNTDMQMVFFVTAMNGMPVTIYARQSGTKSGYYIKTYVSNDGTSYGSSCEVTVKPNGTMTFYTKAAWSTDNTYTKSGTFHYGLTNYEYLGITKLPAHPSQTSPYTWNLNVGEIVWTPSATMYVTPLDFSLYIKASHNPQVYKKYLSGFLLFVYNGSEWVQTSYYMGNSNSPLSNGTYCIYLDSDRNNTTSGGLTIYRLKPEDNSYALEYGVNTNLSGATEVYDEREISWP